MQPPLVVILLSLLAAIFSGLLTYFITSISNKKQVEETMKVCLDTHVKIHHQQEITTLVENRITEHQVNCDGYSKMESIQDDIKALRTALIFLVVKNNGNPKELGLI